MQIYLVLCHAFSPWVTWLVSSFKQNTALLFLLWTDVICLWIQELIDIHWWLFFSMMRKPVEWQYVVTELLLISFAKIQENGFEQRGSNNLKLTNVVHTLHIYIYAHYLYLSKKPLFCIFLEIWFFIFQLGIHHYMYTLCKTYTCASVLSIQLVLYINFMYSKWFQKGTF